jgi:hypothetical protein
LLFRSGITTRCKFSVIDLEQCGARHGQSFPSPTSRPITLCDLASVRLPMMGLKNVSVKAVSAGPQLRLISSPQRRRQVRGLRGSHHIIVHGGVGCAVRWVPDTLTRLQQHYVSTRAPESLATRDQASGWLHLTVRPAVPNGRFRRPVAMDEFFSLDKVIRNATGANV